MSMIIDPRVYSGLLDAVDTRVKQHLAQQPRTAYGVVESVDAANAKAAVYVSGDPAASAGFAFPAHTKPKIGDLVRVVIDPRGDRYVDATFPADYLLSNPGTIQIDQKDAGDSSLLYPFGVSVFNTGVGLSLGWPNDFVSVITFKQSTDRVFQLISTHSGGAKLWWRIGHSSTFGSNEFSPEFYRLDNKTAGYVVRKTSTFSIGSDAWTNPTDWTNSDFIGDEVTWNAGGSGGLTVELAGLYAVNIAGQFPANTSGTHRLVGVGINGYQPQQWHHKSFPVHNNVIYMEGSWLVPLSAGDIVRALYYQTAGVSLTASNFLLGVARIGNVAD